MKVQLLAGALSALVIATGAAADTIATFSDPAPTGVTPVFMLSGSTFSGGWSGTGLTLRTPGLLDVGDFDDATFTMTPLTVSVAASPLYLLSGGTIEFFDSGGNAIFQIDFTAAVVTAPLSFGSSDAFVGQNVTFSGAILGGQTVTNESFAFSFANPAMGQDGFSVTSAFTSSADIPAPATLAGAGVALLLSSRRRRRTA